MCIASAVLLALGAAAGTTAAMKERPLYPDAPRAEVREEIQGTMVADPYRPLEDEGSTATRAWKAAQERLLDSYLHGVPNRQWIDRRLTELLSFDSVTPAAAAGGRYFFTTVAGPRTANLGRLRMGRQPYGEDREILDVVRRHGPDAQLRGYQPGPDGRTVLYRLGRRGSTDVVLHLIDADSGTPLDDPMAGVHVLSAPPAWRRDASGFFYLRNAPSEELLFHRLGTSSSRDVLIPVEDAGPGWLHTLRVSDDDRTLVVTAQQGARQDTRVFVLDLRAPGARPSALVAHEDGALTFLGGREGRLLFYTDVAAPRGRIVEIDVDHASRDHWRVVVPQMEEAIAAHDQTGGNALGFYGGRLVLMYLRDGQPFLRIFREDGRLEHTIELPAAGSIWGGFTGDGERSDVFYQFLGLVDPCTIYRLDVRAGTASVAYRAAVPLGEANIDVHQEFYRSRDGVAVPIFVARRKGLPLDGTPPAMMYGYGALGWVSFIWYQPHVLAWLEMGGVYAQPSLRGGGEYGAAWHEAATRTRKQTTVDDYLAAAEWLIHRGYTSPTRLVANGGSLSGPLAAIAAQQRPDLFAAAVVDRPIADLVRYEQLGHAAVWAPELGTVARADEFQTLYALSPYHRALQASVCPSPTLVMAGEADRTALPAHASKLVAALQSRTECTGPYLLKVMRGAGHDFGPTPAEVTNSFGTWLAFLSRHLGLATPE